MGAIILSAVFIFGCVTVCEPQHFNGLGSPEGAPPSTGAAASSRQRSAGFAGSWQDYSLLQSAIFSHDRALDHAAWLLKHAGDRDFMRQRVHASKSGSSSGSASSPAAESDPQRAEEDTFRHLLQSARDRVLATYSTLETQVVAGRGGAHSAAAQVVRLVLTGVGVGVGAGASTIGLPEQYISQVLALGRTAVPPGGGAPTPTPTPPPHLPVIATVRDNHPTFVLTLADMKRLARHALVAAELARRGVPDHMLDVFRFVGEETGPDLGPVLHMLLAHWTGGAAAAGAPPAATTPPTIPPPPLPPVPVDEGYPEYPELLPTYASARLPGWDHALALAGLLYAIPAPQGDTAPPPNEARKARESAEAASSAGYVRLDLSMLREAGEEWRRDRNDLHAGGLVEQAKRMGRRPPPVFPGSQAELDAVMRSQRSASADLLAFARSSAVRGAFAHAWGAYSASAWGQDVLRPHSMEGERDHCDMGVTLVDAVDTALLMGHYGSYVDAQAWVAGRGGAGGGGMPNRIGGQAFISLFECTIRVLGGLLSTADLAGVPYPLRAPQKEGVEGGEPPPCTGSDPSSAWVERAEEVGRAFFESGAWLTSTGVPFGTLSLANRTRAVSASGPGRMLPVSAIVPQGQSYNASKGGEEELEAEVVTHPSVPPPPEGAIGIATVAGHAWNPGWAGGASSVSEVATLQLEHMALSARTGKGLYHAVALRPMRHLASLGVADGLFTMMVDPNTGQLKDTTVTLGARGDSTYEYLLKTWLLMGGWRHERRRARVLARAAVRLYLPVWAAKAGIVIGPPGMGLCGTDAERVGYDERVASWRAGIESAGRAAFSYLSSTRTLWDDPRWLLAAYNRAVTGVLDGLLQRSSPSNRTYVAEAAHSRSALPDKTAPLQLLPKMDHLVCFLPGLLGLGSAHGAGHEALAQHVERNIRVRALVREVRAWEGERGVLARGGGEVLPPGMEWMEEVRDGVDGQSHPIPLHVLASLYSIITDRWEGEGELAYDLSQVLSAVDGETLTLGGGSRACEQGARGGEGFSPVGLDGLFEGADMRIEGSARSEEEAGGLPPLSSSLPGIPFANLTHTKAILERLWSEAHALAATCAAMATTTSTGLAPEIVTFASESGDDFTPNADARHCLLRPEAVESFYILHALTGDPAYREYGWGVFSAMEQHARVRQGGYASVVDVDHAGAKKGEDKGMEEMRAHWGSAGRANQRDRQESFTLAETFKYLFLLFREPAGAYGPRVDGFWPRVVPPLSSGPESMLPLVADYSGLFQRGVGGVPWDEDWDGQEHEEEEPEQWVFNTEAHPLRAMPGQRPPSSWNPGAHLAGVLKAANNTNSTDLGPSGAPRQQ